jgi:hypothetical protein
MRERSIRLQRAEEREADRLLKGHLPEPEQATESEATDSTDEAARRSLDRFAQVLAKWERTQVGDREPER